MLEACVVLGTVEMVSGEKEMEVVDCELGVALAMVDMSLYKR